VTDYDDFDWVDSTSGRGSRENSPSNVDNPRGYGQPRNSSRSGNPTRPARPAPSGRGYGASSGPRPPASRGAAPVRRPSQGHAGSRRRPAQASHFGSGVRNLLRRLTKLPKPVLLGVGSLIFLVFLTMVLDSALYYNRVHAGVSVAGQSLGGKTYDEALDTLNQRLAELSTQSISVVSGTSTWTVTPDAVGQVIDPDASVQAAVQVTRKSNLISDLAKRLQLYFNGDNLSLVGKVDREKFDAFVAGVAAVLDVDAVNQTLSIQGENIETVPGKSGYVVDQEKLKALLTGALFAHNTAQIQVPMMRQDPAVMADSIEEAKAQVQTMLSGDVTLMYLAPRPADVTTTTTAGGQTTATTVKKATSTTATTAAPQETTSTTIVQTSAGNLTFVWKTRTFTPSEIQDLLSYKTQDSNGVKVLVPYISADALRPYFAKIEGPMTVPAVDASFQFDGGSPYVKSSQAGKGLDHEATAAALTAAALATGERVAKAVLKDTEPAFTTEAADAMGIKDKLGFCRTEYTKGTDEREWNVKLATAKISNTNVAVNGTSMAKYGNMLIAPGEEFDFIKVLGPRTKEAGFRMAKGIVDGALEDVYGGGICQVSTTLFGALLDAGLKVTERYNHSIYIDHYPRGMDATITGGGAPKDLKFVNNTPNYIWLYGESDGVTTTFFIFGTSDGRQVTTLSASPPYDVIERSSSTITTLDPSVGWGSTSVLFTGQNSFKVRLTRVIEWPNGSTTSETWISSWGIKPKSVAFPTSTTVTSAPKSSTTATTVAGP
jgi:vancomycin resistance protein YoaR